MPKIKKGFEALKDQWSENPVLVLGAVGAFFMGTARLVDAVGGLRSKNAYAKNARTRSKRK